MSTLSTRSTKEVAKGRSDVLETIEVGLDRFDTVSEFIDFVRKFVGRIAPYSRCRRMLSDERRTGD
jgi:hypothetical protein